MNLSHGHALLIVDDHPVYREALGEILAREFSAIGIEVKTASNSSEGMELVDQGDKTWVVLLDVLMPGLSGLAGIKVFKSKPNVQDVISISGLDAQTWEPRAVGAGATLFLSKTAHRLKFSARSSLFLNGASLAKRTSPASKTMASV